MELDKEKPPTLTCEACGHANALPLPARAAPSVMTEADRLLIGRLREENATVRADNLELRADKQRRELRERCSTKIREAGAEGYVQVDDLVAFQEAQWPLLLGRIMGAERAYGGGEASMPAPPAPATLRTTPQTAADVFTAVFDG